MKHLKKYNESLANETLLDELSDMFKEHFLDISDMSEDGVNVFYCYYHGPVSNNQLQRVDFDYTYKNIKKNRNITKEQFDKFIDNNEHNIRLAFHADFVVIPYRKDYESLKIQGYEQLGEPIIDVDEVCKHMNFISEQLPMIVNRLKGEFEEVIVNLGYGSRFEITAFCDKETTKQVGLLTDVVRDSRVFID